MNEYKVTGNPNYSVKADGFYIDRGVLIFFSYGHNREKEPFMSFNKDEWQVVSQRT
jgi:hypothetical protein